MKVDLIIKAKDDYYQSILNQQVKPESLFRRCILKWQEHFDLDEMYLGPVLEKALKNEVSGRFWGGEQYSIKSSLITLAVQNPDLFWTAMKDLLNEDRMIIMRVNRFIHHCDMIFKEYQKKDLKANTHRQNYYSASLLLSLQYPSQYCLFEYPKFENWCRMIEVNQLPVNTDLERFYKIIRATYSIISKDENFMKAYYENLEEDVFFGPSLDIVSNLMSYHHKTSN